MSTSFELEDLNKRWFWILMGPPILLGILIWVNSEFAYGFFAGGLIGILWGIGLSITSVCNQKFRNWVSQSMISRT